MLKMLKIPTNSLFSKINVDDKIILIFISKKTKNIFISCINSHNNKVLNTFSCGQFDFKGRTKETLLASSVLTTKVLIFSLTQGFKKSILIFKGLGFNKKNILRTFKCTKYLNQHLQILLIKDLTQYPYNGCRKSKKRKI